MVSDEQQAKPEAPAVPDWARNQAYANPAAFRSGMHWDGKPAGKPMTMIERYLIAIGRGPPPGGSMW